MAESSDTNVELILVVLLILVVTGGSGDESPAHNEVQLPWAR